MKRKTRLIRLRAAKTAAQIERIGVLETRIADLEGRIARLEKPLPDWTKDWPTSPWPQKTPPDPWGGTSCPKCGLNWKGAMGYVCPDPCCPMGAGPVWCAETAARPLGTDGNTTCYHMTVQQHNTLGNAAPKE